MSTIVNGYGEFGQPLDSRLIECGRHRYIERKLPNGMRELRRESGEVLGYEMVEIAVRGDGWLMVVDEEGRLKPETVVNPIATRIYRHALGLPSEELPSDGTPRMRSVGNAYVVEVPEAGHEPNEIVGAALICAAWRVR